MSDTLLNPEINALLGKQIQLSLMDISNKMIESALKLNASGNIQRRDEVAEMARTLVLAIDHMDVLQDVINDLQLANREAYDKLLKANQRAMDAHRVAKEMIIEDVLKFV